MVCCLKLIPFLSANRSEFGSDVGGRPKVLSRCHEWDQCCKSERWHKLHRKMYTGVTVGFTGALKTIPDVLPTFLSFSVLFFPRYEYY